MYLKFQLNGGSACGCGSARRRGGSARARISGVARVDGNPREGGDRHRRRAGRGRQPGTATRVHPSAVPAEDDLPVGLPRQHRAKALGRPDNGNSRATRGRRPVRSRNASSSASSSAVPMAEPTSRSSPKIRPCSACGAADSAAQPARYPAHTIAPPGRSSSREPEVQAGAADTGRRVRLLRRGQTTGARPARTGGRRHGRHTERSASRRTARHRTELGDRPEPGPAAHTAGPVPGCRPAVVPYRHRLGDPAAHRGRAVARPLAEPPPHRAPTPVGRGAPGASTTRGPATRINPRCRAG